MTHYDSLSNAVWLAYIFYVLDCFFVLFYLFSGFTVSPGNKWVLESGRVYEIGVEVLDKDRHKIHLSEVVRLY